ncbi:MAG TPA: hypothetical protein VGM39_08755 [Kofleriaceae bacterium]
MIVYAISVALIFCAVVTAGTAAHKGRNPYGWGVVGACFGLVGFLIASLQDPLPGSNEVARLAHEREAIAS